MTRQALALLTAVLLGVSTLLAPSDKDVTQASSQIQVWTASDAKPETSDGYVREVVCAEHYRWDCETALRIVWRESRNDPQAINPASLCAGWWQIHPIHGYAVEALMDPVFNTHVAYQLWLASGWRPWRVQ